MHQVVLGLSDYAGARDIVLLHPVIRSQGE